MTNPTEATVQQPAPAPGEGDVWVKVIEDVKFLWQWRDPGEKNTWEVIKKDACERREFGKKKYGVPVQVENGRNHPVDMLQELLDAAVYGKAACLKRPWDTEMHELYRDTVLLLFRLRTLMIADGDKK